MHPEQKSRSPRLDGLGVRAYSSRGIYWTVSRSILIQRDPDRTGGGDRG